MNSKKKSDRSKSLNSNEKLTKTNNSSNLESDQPSKKTEKIKRSSTMNDKAKVNLEFFDSYLNFKIESKFQQDKKFVIEQWKKIEIMRNSVVAPVDTMGVECCPEENLPENQKRFQFLVSLLISSQTKDNITYSTVKKLSEYGFTLEKINKIKEEDLAEMLYGVSFHNTKAKHIKNMTKMLISEYDSMPPDTYKEVVKLPGIGPKMGNLYMQACFGVNNGVAVDTHVHRISKRLKWVKSSNNPEKTRIYLEQWLPVELYSHINTLLVGFGQTRCKAVKPQCEDCLLNNECEFGIEELASRKLKSKRRKKSKSFKSDDFTDYRNKSKSKHSKNSNNNLSSNKNSKNKISNKKIKKEQDENDNNNRFDINLKSKDKDEDKEKSYFNIEAYSATPNKTSNSKKTSKEKIIKSEFKNIIEAHYKNDSNKFKYVNKFSSKKKKLKIEEEN